MISGASSLRVKQVNQIGVDVVHIPSLTSVQEGVSFSVVKGVSFGVAPHRIMYCFACPRYGCTDGGRDLGTALGRRSDF